MAEFILVQVISKGHYSFSVLKSILKFQLVQNSLSVNEAAGAVMCVSGRTHVISLLHWLPVYFWAQFKMLVLLNVDWKIYKLLIDLLYKEMRIWYFWDIFQHSTRVDFLCLMPVWMRHSSFVIIYFVHTFFIFIISVWWLLVWFFFYILTLE